MMLGQAWKGILVKVFAVVKWVLPFLWESYFRKTTFWTKNDEFAPAESSKLWSYLKKAPLPSIKPILTYRSYDLLGQRFCRAMSGRFSLFLVHLEALFPLKINLNFWVQTDYLLAKAMYLFKYLNWREAQPKPDPRRPRPQDSKEKDRRKCRSGQRSKPNTPAKSFPDGYLQQ